MTTDYMMSGIAESVCGAEIDKKERTTFLKIVAQPFDQMKVSKSVV